MIFIYLIVLTHKVLPTLEAHLTHHFVFSLVALNVPGSLGTPDSNNSGSLGNPESSCSSDSFPLFFAV